MRSVWPGLEETTDAVMTVVVRVARFLEERAVGADMMVASIIRVVMDLSRLYAFQSCGSRKVRQLVHLHCTGDILFTQCGRAPACSTSLLAGFAPAMCYHLIVTI